MSRAIAMVAVSLAVLAAGENSLAQGVPGAEQPPPWGETLVPAPDSPDAGNDTDSVSDARSSIGPVPHARRWPNVRPRPSASAVVEAPPPVDAMARDTVGDLGVVQYFQFPSARLLRYGDVVGQYVSHLGWGAARFGLSRRIDVGVGVPFYVYGISVDARVAFVQSQRFAAAWWGYASVPFRVEADRSTSCLGFTWAYGGMGWVMGPLFTFWQGRLTVSTGLHLAQRTGLGGVWLLGHLTVDFRITDGVKALAQTFALYEVSLEHGEGAGALLGNGTPRLLPYALGGVRFYTRRFFADLGLLVPLAEASPLYSDRLAALPWVSLGHRF